ncbi:type II toxin-antitoxin system RelE/ParE family toxin [Alkalilimnicola sp. S0819]|uniref:type II toxin-antitoxin system RelE/ParE family toxin n=1 Tax=Alkalilimnicola sp. S0819 TaxID=2613922 RepID=UPI0012626E7F|nr:type II toxin-antitoxin system RelE/ParE family toxin [Alkalilimnicola sp. S0819]KAB7627190.1 type II toxin-antitoxin system RelE/ParE family toxin [Alkalilimnicola sp. S0819]MPQ15903.1 type II toxin-antitoxin system RelE/ParE family toxin [Alkalilimnicola sp. S0819]
MIRSFRNRETAALFRDEAVRRFPPDLRKAARRKLLLLDQARVVEDLLIPPGNRLESLHADRQGQWSIRINRQWRLCFRFEDGHAWDVEIVDYH